tara:strand:+ start:582 stop:905 length:324 start_codon:yes stop_codon:yes gene_type:complete
MANLDEKIKAYAKDKKILEIDFLKDVILQDDGKGAYIKEWNLSINKPTDKELSKFDEQAEKNKKNNNVRVKRKIEYGDIGDQLDEIYKDIDAWKARIKKIKDDNPKE